ncbi:MAG: ABC transporter permease [Terriglobia bacterium]
MNGLLQQFAVSLRLYFRNKMGMFYGYVFPAIFLLAFWVLYRYEPVPLARHMGQLLTVTILGGACLGMPTTMVSERERGVWRRYRMTPVSAPSLVASAVILRFCILITAALLQLVLAFGIGMPLPRNSLGLGVAFIFVAFAFLGLGLVIATLADTVPSVQALGQCIFLPMLIIGGVAVPLESLPDWALHLSRFFPGRYAVAALQSAFTGSTTWPAGFDLLALLLIGVAGMIAGSQMFRWDAQQRFASRSGKSWLIVVFAAWASVGLLSEWRARASVVTVVNHPASPQPRPVAVAPPANPLPATNQPRKAALPYAGPPDWQAVTVAEIKRDVDFAGLPPDGGIITPIARQGLAAPPDMQEQLDALSAALPAWQPGNVTDPVQRVRNLLYVAAVPDVLEMEILEGYVPRVVFDHLKKVIPKDDLVKLLYWVATHPSSGSDTAANQLEPLGLPKAPVDLSTVRERVSIYAVKFIGRMIGSIPSN